MIIIVEQELLDHPSAQESILRRPAKIPIPSAIIVSTFRAHSIPPRHARHRRLTLPRPLATKISRRFHPDAKVYPLRS